MLMHCFRGAFFLVLALGLTACETPLGQSWNNAVSRLSPPPEDDRDARYGLNSNQPKPRKQSGSIDSDSVYLGPKPTRTMSTQPSVSNGPVRLKPFRSSTRNNVAPTPKPTRKVSTNPTPKQTSKPTPTPTPKPVSKRQTAPTPNLEGPEPIVETAPKKVDEPPSFASPVPGKKGYVTSPYSPDAGFIDVTGLDPGSLAKDPYSGKVFRVP